MTGRPRRCSVCGVKTYAPDTCIDCRGWSRRRTTDKSDIELTNGHWVNDHGIMRWVES